MGKIAIEQFGLELWSGTPYGHSLIGSREELETMDAEARSVANEAAEFADASPKADPAELYEHVYATINEHGRLFMDGRVEAPRAGDEGS